jgi:hypothetical protein
MPPDSDRSRSRKTSFNTCRRIDGQYDKLLWGLADDVIKTTGKYEAINLLEKYVENESTTYL